MKPKWWERQDPTTETMEWLDRTTQLVKCTETNSMSGRKTCKYAVVNRWGDSTPWLPSAAAAKLAHAMAPEPKITTYPDAWADALTYGHATVWTYVDEHGLLRVMP